MGNTAKWPVLMLCHKPKNQKKKTFRSNLKNISLTYSLSLWKASQNRYNEVMLKLKCVSLVSTPRYKIKWFYTSYLLRSIDKRNFVFSRQKTVYSHPVSFTCNLMQHKRIFNDFINSFLQSVWLGNWILINRLHAFLSLNSCLSPKIPLKHQEKKNAVCKYGL